jgi:hypothetical protein
MDVNRFNTEVRPYLTEFPIGIQGIGFDRIEMDAYADQYVSRNGRPPEIRRERWDTQEDHQGCNNAVESGGLINESEDTDDWLRAVEQQNSQKRKDT